MVFAPQFAQALQPGHDRYPNAVPATSTPSVLNGEVLDIVQIGNTIVSAGAFSSVSSPGGSAVTRNNVFAFNAATGQLSSTFTPSVNGTVDAVLPGPTAGTVYLAGSFTQVNGANASHVALVNVSNGQTVTGFRAAATNGRVYSIQRVGNRLFIAGNFTTTGGVAHRSLATLNVTTGALDPYMNLQTAGRHNDSGSGAQGAMGVRDIEITNAGDRMVVMGNFKQIDGLVRDQVAIVNLPAGSAELDANWRTRRYEPYCFNWAFDTYVRSVSIAPDDSYFVLASTGGHNTGTLCDTIARWDFSDSGQDVQEAWFSDSGGDTLWATTVTEKAVFVGGHQRWMNNDNGSDFAGPGAVPRAGLAALNPTSGIPIPWNPGRNPRGAAVYALYPTETGLWMGSDTEYVGDVRYRRPRIAFFPLAGGLTEPSDTQQQLPGNVYLAGKRSVDQGNVIYRVNTGGGAVSATDGGPDWNADDSDPSPVRNNGSNSAGYDPAVSRDTSLPAHAPTSLFDSERWSPSDDPRMSWDFPVPAGRQLQVRLFFANRYAGTSQVGQRVFDVELEGTTRMNDFDIVQAVGDQRGMMRSFDITSDGNVDIDFSHVVENPLINGIEIVDRTLPPPSNGGSTLSTIDFDGTTAGSATGVDGLGVDWGQVRGSFLIGNTLYYGWADGQLYKRTFSSSGVGPATLIDPYHDPIWDNASSGSGGTFRGATSAFYGQITNLTGLVYRDGRIYYTLNNDSNLYWRGFNADSGIVGTRVHTANGGINWSTSSGLFTSGNTLYVVNKSNGSLGRVNFAGGVPQGTVTTVNSSNDWRARGIFIAQGVAPNQAPTARMAVTCVKLVCSVDGTTSTDPEGADLTYAWDFGDDGAATGGTASHTYDEDGGYTIRLTVTDDRGGSDTVERVVNVAAGTASSVSFVASTSSNMNSATPAVTVPSGVQAGDQLMLFGSGTDLGVPSGWTLVDSRTASGMESHVWTRRATGADAGTTVTIPTTFGKTVLVLAAYRGVDGASPVAAIASTTDTGTSHTSATVNAPENAWVLQFWSDKSSGTTTWNLPGTIAERERSIGSGSGRKSAVLADSNGGVAAGVRGGVTATTDAWSGRAISWTLALRPAS
nr:PKD domain-containing protein [Nocardioides daedukensis]